MVEGALKVEAVLLTGYLGAGKTTLLNRLIKAYSHKKTAVLVNEFGSIGIDGSRLSGGDYDLIELNRGSLFCICVRTDFIAAVRRVAEEIRPDILLIEATGIADTSEMERMMALPQIAEAVCIKAVVCLVDPLTFPKVSVFLKAPATQVRMADLLIINKSDLVDDRALTELESRIRDINPDAPVIRAVRADFSLELLEGMHHRGAGGGLPGEGRTDVVSSVSLSGRGSIPAADWHAFRRNLKGEVLRLKGRLTLDGRTVDIDEVGEQIEITPAADPPSGDNELVVIGLHLDAAEMKDWFGRILQA